MTNKPMLSVERELLESCWAALMQKGQVVKALELRALLDNPVLESQYAGMTQDQAQAVSDGVDEILHGKPDHLYRRCTILKECNVKSSAASGVRINAIAKPITRRVCHGCVGVPRDVFCPVCDDEQPAPVAVVMPERMNLRSSDGSETYETKSWNAALDAVEKLNGFKS